jgi:hypothetical protein
MTRYIVNPGGAVHSVGEEELTRLLRLPGYREATTEEIAGWYDWQGLPVPAEVSPANPIPNQATTDADASDHKSGVSLSDLPARSSSKRPRKNRSASSG